MRYLTANIVIPGPGPVIWINGFPGTWKSTVAKELARIRILSILIDNHKLTAPAQMKFSQDHPRYQIDQKRRRQWAFEHFVFEPTRLSEAVIFTSRLSNSFVHADMWLIYYKDFLLDNQTGRNTAQEYCEAAQKAGRSFIPVYLSCDVEANIMRATNTGRTQGTTTKLTCPNAIRAPRERHKLFQFGSPYEELYIDTTSLTKREAALMIRTHVEKCLLMEKGK